MCVWDRVHAMTAADCSQHGEAPGSCAERLVQRHPRGPLALVPARQVLPPGAVRSPQGSFSLRGRGWSEPTVTLSV